VQRSAQLAMKVAVTPVPVTWLQIDITLDTVVGG
jgi:hypothetical protein